MSNRPQGKPPRSVWVDVGTTTGQALDVRSWSKPGWTRYDLHLPKSKPPRRKATRAGRGA